MSHSVSFGPLPKAFAATIFAVIFGACASQTSHAAAAINSGASAHANSAAPALFTPLSTATKFQADESASVKRDREIVRSVRVQIDPSLLTASGESRPDSSTPSQSILLNLFDDVSYVAQLDRFERTPRGLTWIGHLRDVVSSQVVFVINGNVTAGTIVMPGARYHIRFSGNGVHTVQQIDQRQYPQDEATVPVPDRNVLRSRAQKSALPSTDGLSIQRDDGSMVDVMVVYDTTSMLAAGGVPAMQGLIDLAIAEANQSYRMSGVALRIRLVHTEQVDYQETGHLQDALNCVTSVMDGCLDNIHALRTTYGADLVSFWVETGGDECGIGWLMDTPSESFESFAFGVVTKSCANGYYAFVHELGHNMGANHDVLVVPATSDSPTDHGYVNTAGRWYTIMAYDNACTSAGVHCERIPYWSNQDSTYNGAPLGDGTADNRQILNNNAVIVANFRASVIPVDVVRDAVVEFYNMGLDNYFITGSASEAAAIDGGSAGPGWARTGNTFKTGGSNSVCRFYGSQSPGPNSHFFTVDATECADLKQLQATTPITQKRWNFESLDFVSTAQSAGTCPAGTQPIYRAYNNGFARGIDSNHRITGNAAAIDEVVARGWVNEGVAMCAPV